MRLHSSPGHTGCKGWHYHKREVTRLTTQKGGTTLERRSHQLWRTFTSISTHSIKIKIKIKVYLSSGAFSFASWLGFLCPFLSYCALLLLLAPGPSESHTLPPARGESWSSISVVVAVGHCHGHGLVDLDLDPAVDLDPDLAAALRPALHLPPRPFHRLAHGAVALVLALAPAADLDPRDPKGKRALRKSPRVNQTSARKCAACSVALQDRAHARACHSDAVCSQSQLACARRGREPASQRSIYFFNLFQRIDRRLFP